MLANSVFVIFINLVEENLVVDPRAAGRSVVGRHRGVADHVRVVGTSACPERRFDGVAAPGGQASSMVVDWRVVGQVRQVADAAAQ